jgi:CheY-like chemotaxis protein
MMKKSDAHVLIVEDDQTMGNAIKELLTRSGYKATLVVKPDDALSIVKLQGAQAAVIDCMLPKMNGRDLAKKLRESGAPDLPIILLSGIYKDKNFIREAIQATGAIAFLTKPFDLDELMSLIDQQLANVIDTPISPIYEAMFKEKLSAKERINAINDSEEVHGYDLPWIYSLLMHPRVNGHLNIISADGEVSGVGFQKGRIVQVSQKDTKSYFGVLMVEHGFISQEELEEVMRLSAKTRKVGERLVEANLLSPHAIRLVMAEQQAIRLSRTVADTSVKVNFSEAEEMREDADIDQADFIVLLNDWINSKVSTEWLKSAYLPWMNFEIRKGPEFDPDHRIFTQPVVQKAEGLAQALFAEGLTLELMLSKVNLSEDTALRAVHALLLSRVVVFDEKKKSPSNYDMQRKRLQKLVEDLERQNHFERLGVSQKAKESEIKRAFHELAKILHPDKLAQDTPIDVRALTRDAFNMINQAHEVLSNPASKADYLRELENGRAEAVLQAEQLAEQARAFLSAGDISRGRIAIEEAIAMAPPTSDLRLLHNWARLKAPGIERNKEALEEIRESMSKIPAEDRHHALYYFVKGLLQKASLDPEGARRSYEHAISIETAFIDARRELNILINQDTNSKPVNILSGDLKDVVGMLFKKKK